MTLGSHFFNRVSTNCIYIMITKLRPRSKWISAVNFQINIFLFFIFVINGVRLEVDPHRLIWVPASDWVWDFDRGFWQRFLLLQSPAVNSIVLLLWCLLQVFNVLLSWFDDLFSYWRKTTNSTSILFEILYLIELLKDSWNEKAVRDKRNHQKSYKKYGTVHTADVT